MEFEWNRNKARENERKHCVSFAEAAEVFADEYSSTAPDPDHSIEEDRYVIFGKTERNRFLAVAFTERNGRIRIISARQMTRRERKAYEQ
ncbi:MAG: BrnT family toxin [Nitrococcus sp.]|nr:BrnT family toxin [Nitrococcus sp.]